MADQHRPNSEGHAPEERKAGADQDAAQEVQSDAGAPQAPVLVAPREEALVDGADVTLRWEPMEGVDTYLVEVAEDAPFHEVVVQKEVEGGSLSLDALSTDGALYYWRVLARRGGAWSHGDRIESFVSVTAEQARASAESRSGGTPDEGEGYGPAAELVSAAGAEASAEAMGSEAQLARERERGVAHEGVESGQIIGLAGVVLLALLIIVCILFFWITSVAQTTRQATTEASVYPELEKTETNAAQQLHQYELVSERDSTYRIPIDEAMRIVTDETYEQGGQGQKRRYSGELPMGLPLPSDSLGPDAFVPEPSAPEGPAGSLAGSPEAPR